MPGHFPPTLLRERSIQNGCHHQAVACRHRCGCSCGFLHERRFGGHPLLGQQRRHHRRRRHADRNLGLGHVLDRDPNGEAATTGWTADELAVFSAGTDAITPFTVTVDGTQSASSLTFEEGDATLAGGTLNLNGVGSVIGTGVVTVDSPTATISSILGGSVGLTKAGLGTLTLSGANTFTNNVVVNAGVLSVGGGIDAPTSNAMLGDAANSITLNGGTLRLTSTIGLDQATANTRAISSAPAAARSTSPPAGPLGTTASSPALEA